MIADLRHALRSFAKRPAFAVSAIIPLALGIAATTAIFSVVNAVLLKPLPYADPDRLVHLWVDLRTRNVVDFPWSPADFHDLRNHAGVFDDVAALTTGRQVTGGRVGLGEADVVSVAAATPNVFRLLGARVILGRDFADADGVPLRAPVSSIAASPPPRAIISHEFWQRRFGGSAGVVDAVVRLGDQAFEIIGVLEPGFELLFPTASHVERVPDIWTPLRLDFAAASRANAFLRVIGRLQPSVPVAEARSQTESLAAALRARSPINETSGLHLRLERMDHALVAQVRPSILALMGAVLFVFLIACANVGNLLLIRALARERELAVRAAIGGTRQQLARQLLAEGLLLALLAGALAVGLAWVGVRMLRGLAPAHLPRLDQVAIDPTVAGFAVMTGLLSVLIFGLVPALRASRTNVIGVLRNANGASAASAGRWLRRGVVTVEVALCFVLVTGSGLLVRSHIALQHVQPGYDANNVLTFLIPSLRLTDPAARQAFMATLKERVSALPGVIAVAAASPLPLDGRSALARWGTEDALSDPTRFQQATAYHVTPGYFETMRTRLIEGRTFTDADNVLDARVMVIDRLLAARAFPGQPAVGRTLLARLRTQDAERFQVIGVVDHQRHGSLAADGREGLYVLDGYGTYGAANRWAVRVDGDPATLAPQIRGVVSAINPRVGVIEVQPMDTDVTRAKAQTTFVLVLTGIFASIAVVLAGGGLYSVLSTSVRQRTAEIGVRMAFGAERTRIFRMMIADGLRLTGAGIVAGTLAALALTGKLRTMLVGVEPTDPFTFAAVAAGCLAAAAIACGAPAMRAARLDPMVALREH